MTTTSKGYLLIILSALFYGSLPLVVKIAYQHEMTPGQALLLRYILAAAILIVVLSIMRLPVFVFSRVQLLQGLSYVCGSIFYLTSIFYLPASLAALLFFSNPIVVVLLTIFIDRTKFNTAFYLALALSILGLAFIVDLSGAANANIPFKGIVFALLGSLFWGIYSYLGQRTMANGKSPLSVAASIMIVSAVVLSLVYIKEVPSLVSLNLVQWGIGSILALFNSVLGIILFLRGITYIGAARSSLVATLEPLIGVILAIIFLQESLPFTKVIGAIMMFSGVIITRLTGNEENIKA